MRGPAQIKPGRAPKAESPELTALWRDRLAVLLALVAVACIGWTFFLANDLQFLAPGPLTSAHSAITECSTCHTKSGRGRMSWLHGLNGGDRRADSSACLSCHTIPDTAFNAHSASVEVLNWSKQRLTKIAAETPAPQSARVQDAAFSTHDLVARGLSCATCHKEHQGAKFNLRKISSEQCNSCHMVKFDSFDGHHPEFKNYPFKQRTRIIFDHVGHAFKHYPDTEKRDPNKRIPTACSTCHDGGTGRRVMGVAPFERTCTACHLGQITGADRVGGSKGIAFLTLPGLDLNTLKQRNVWIGEWPDASEAELTPFMKIMISRHERGRAVIQTLESLNLQDLSGATDDQIRAVAELVWEIKRLFYALISAKASDVLGDLSINCGARLSAGLVADLTASMPRDVVIGAHRQWLPNLGAEMANRQDTSDQDQTCGSTTAGQAAAPPRAAPPRAAPPASAATTAPHSVALPRAAAVPPSPAPPTAAPPAVAPRAAAPSAVPSDAVPPAGERSRSAPPQAEAAVAGDVANGPPQNRPADQTDDLLNLTEEERREADQSKSAVQKIYTVRIGHDGGRAPLAGGNAELREETTDQTGDVLLPAGDARLRIKASVEDGVKIAQLEGVQRSADRQPQGKPADQTDDLLFPTEEELNGLPGSVQDALRALQRQPVEPARKADTAAAAPAPGNATSATPPAPAGAPANVPPPGAPADVPVAAPANSGTGAADTGAAGPRASAVPVISIENDVDPESWAEYGGWYRQDYAILYRPTGHKDKFIYSWLVLTGLQAPKGGTTPAAAVFDLLTSKGTPGACVKCHSVDEIENKGRLVNFSPRSGSSRRPGRFTNFVHEPHFGILENRGCLTCHNIEDKHPYLQSFEHGDPKKFVSNFGAVNKELCQSCHNGSMARQDCLVCHKYHVNGVTTPLMSTKVPGR